MAYKKAQVKKADISETALHNLREELKNTKADLKSTINNAASDLGAANSKALAKEQILKDSIKELKSKHSKALKSKTNMLSLVRQEKADLEDTLQSTNTKLITVETRLAAEKNDNLDLKSKLRTARISADNNLTNYNFSQEELSTLREKVVKFLTWSWVKLVFSSKIERIDAL